VDSTDWTFDGTWPYEPHWFDSVDGRLHYVDEGPREGRPVVMVHGNVTWGYLFRHLIPPVVEAGHRAIVPDLLGFGRSDKPPGDELYTVERQIERTDALLESLDLRNAVVVANDWGGPVAFAWAVRHPERVSGIVVTNTFVHRPPRKLKHPLPLRLVRNPITGYVLVKRVDILKRAVLFKSDIVHRELLTPTLKRAYRAPHPTAQSRTAMAVFPREVPQGPDGRVPELLGEISEGLAEHFSDKPALIFWGTQDTILKETMVQEDWLRTFPDAKVVLLNDAGHYPTEDAWEEIVPALRAFLADGAEATSLDSAKQT
jgi:pimeloyl-ACP methyl ester carboxylesterase